MISFITSQSWFLAQNKYKRSPVSKRPMYIHMYMHGVLPASLCSWSSLTIDLLLSLNHLPGMCGVCAWRITSQSLFLVQPHYRPSPVSRRPMCDVCAWRITSQSLFSVQVSPLTSCCLSTTDSSTSPAGSLVNYVSMTSQTENTRSLLAR